MHGDLSGMGRRRDARAESEELFRVFQQHYTAAGLGLLIGWLAGRAGRLQSLAALRQERRVRASRSAGLRSVPITAISGSESRCGDFDRRFRPLRAGVWERWRDVARAFRAGAALPPVELFQVGGEYFVRDGHHRISVAEAFGQREVDALVTVLEFEGDEMSQPA